MTDAGGGTLVVVSSVQVVSVGHFPPAGAVAMAAVARPATMAILLKNCIFTSSRQAFQIGLVWCMRWMFW